MSLQLFTGICFPKNFIKGGKNLFEPIKYRNINNLEKFERFAMKKFSDRLGAINFYEKESKQFFKQIKF